MSERVYVEDGTVAHELQFGESPNDRAAQALCGRTSWPGYWFGTGDQDEYDTAAAMPLCVACASVLRHRAGG
ncbi:hypothetical protein [Streptomyces griseus]|uniref:hypothetical protein n=1 Tax=Streptomyces griseus TaxID=1911 RepID=UPI0033F6CE13